MNRQAAFQAAICTAAMAGVSAAVATFVQAANGGPLDWLRALGAFGSLAVASWLMYVGHCRNMIPKAAA